MFSFIEITFERIRVGNTPVAKHVFTQRVLVTTRTHVQLMMRLEVRVVARTRCVDAWVETSVSNPYSFISKTLTRKFTYDPMT